MSTRNSDTGSGRKRAILLKLTVVARQLRKAFDQRVASIGVTRSQWAVIAVIARRPGISQREVAEIMEMSEASAGRLIDRLCADGMLERRRKDGDRRAHRVYLTDAAGPILEKISVIGRDHEDALLAGLDTACLEGLERSLDVMAANMAPGLKSPA
jgi:MarR family transcriptional regulator, transcriptional regulator for hemolysin